MCIEAFVQACVAQGHDPMACRERALLVCTNGDPNDPPPPPPPDPATCVENAVQLCLAQGGSQAACQHFAEQACGIDPPPTCEEVLTQFCIDQGNSDPMTCAAFAAEACANHGGMGGAGNGMP